MLKLNAELLSKEIFNEVVYLKKDVIDVLDLTSEYSDYLTDCDGEMTYSQYKNEIKKQVKKVFYDPSSRFVYGIFTPHEYIDLCYVDDDNMLIDICLYKDKRYKRKCLKTS